ncbi:MAG: tetratricopeptide repeat protein [Candidatus Acidiferrales bacterium]
MARLFAGPLALILLLLGSALALSAAQTGPSHAAEIQDHFRKAAQDLQANDANAALQEFDAVLAIDPKNAAALTNRGAVRFLEGDCQSAAPDFQRALAIEPSLVKTKAMLGICEIRMGRSSGKATLESVYPKLTEKHLRTQVGMELAELYYQQGDLDHTVSMVQSLLAADPDNVDILYFAQLVYADMADDTLNKLTIVAPGSARMQQVIAEHLVNEGDADGAIEHYRKCLELDPHMPGVRYELAEAILESAPSKPDAQAEAQKELEDAIQTEGDNANIESELGAIALIQSDTPGAYTHYQRAFAMNPASVDAQLGLGHVLMLLGKPEDALKYLRMAVAADPLNGEAHYRLSTVYKRLNMPDDAAKELKLFEEIKETKDQVRQIYMEMKKHPQGDKDVTPDASDAPTTPDSSQ